MRYLIILLCLISQAYAGSLQLNRSSKKEMNEQIAVTIHYPLISGHHLTTAPAAFNQASRKIINQELIEFKKNAVDFKVIKPTQTGNKNTLEISYQPFILTAPKQILVSVRYNIYTNFVGTAYPSIQHQVLNYDFSKKKILKLNDLFTANTDYMSAIKKYTTSYYQKNKPDVAIDNYLSYDNWNLSEKGITFTFDDFPHVYGPQMITVPFEIIQAYVATESPIYACTQHLCHNSKQIKLS